MLSKFRLRRFFSTVALTPQAASKIKNLKSASKKLRLSVEGGGCSGFQYIFSTSDVEVAETDKVFDELLVIDDTSLQFVEGATVTWSEDLIRQGFEVIDNPNAEAGCGCGASFEIKL